MAIAPKKMAMAYAVRRGAAVGEQAKIMAMAYVRFGVEVVGNGP